MLRLCGIAPSEQIDADPPPADTAATAVDADNPEQRAFVLALYGLVWSIAAQRVGAPGESAANDEAEADVVGAGETGVVAAGAAAEAESEAESEGLDDLAAAPGEWAGSLHTTFDAARDEIARILYWSMNSEAYSGQHIARPERGSRLREKLRWLATGLLDALLDAMSEDYVRKLPLVQEVDVDGKLRSRIPIVVGGQLSQRIDRFLAELPFEFTLQPLRRAPVYQRTETRGKRRDGRFLLELVGYRATNDWLDGFLDHAEFVPPA